MRRDRRYSTADSEERIKRIKAKKRLTKIVSTVIGLCIFALGMSLYEAYASKEKRKWDDIRKGQFTPTYNSINVQDMHRVQESLFGDTYSKHRNSQVLQKQKEFNHFLQKVQTLETEVNNHFRNRNLTSDKLSILSNQLTGAKIIAEEYKKAGFPTDSLVQRLTNYTSKLHSSQGY